MIALLRSNRDFRTVFIAQLVSFMGDWFASVAIIGLLVELTGSDLAATLVFVFQQLPGFLLSPVTGAAADRFDRRRLMVVVSLCQSVAALGFLAVGPSTTWLAYVVLVSVSGLAAFFSPASQAALPNLVDRRDLPTAVAMMSSTWGAMLAIGAALGGVVTLVFGRRVSFVADAATFLLAAVLIFTVRRPMSEARPEATGERVRMRPIADTREALAYARRNPPVMALLASKMGFGLSSGIVGLLAVFAIRTFDAGDAGIGLMLSLRGVGAVLGPFVARRFIRDDTGGILTACGVAAIVYAGSYSLLPLAPSIAIAAVVPLFAHLGGGAQWTLSTYGLQQVTPDAFRGRIFAADFALVTLTMSASFSIAGALSDRLGPGPVTFGLAGVGVTWGLVYLALTRKLRAEAPSPATSVDGS